MTFNSLTYVLFLPAVLALYWRTGQRPRQWVLLVASYVFYGAWDRRFLGLIWLSTAVDYAVGRWLAVEDRAEVRRRLLLVSIGVNLGILGFFKYAGFFVESAGALLERVGLAPNPPLLEILLPVGISFYTFQTLSYTVDVYRRKVEAERDPLTFAVFVAYFPQLVAGPIERAGHLLPQLRTPRRAPGPEEVTSAVALILLGLTKKVVVADTMAPIVQRSFADPDALGTVSVALAATAFALQVYGDFSGYTDIARGTSRLLGIELVPNFRQPLLSRSITELWRTWHMSLYGWLREYVYIPLGGNRGGPLATHRNLLITMTLGGLWHGAAWTFVLWGFLHGVLLVAERLRGVVADDEAGLPRGREWLAVVRTFSVFALSLLIFRSDSLAGAGTMFRNLVLGGLAVDGDVVSDLAVVALGALVILAVDVIQRRRSRGATAPLRVPTATGALAAVAVAGIVAMSGSETVPFIYFQF